jgi:hypothetical protein
MRHLAGRRCELSQKPGASSVLHFLGKLMHGLLRNDAAFFTGKRSFRVVERKKKFRPSPLAFFPQGKRFLHGILSRVQPSIASSVGKGSASSKLQNGRGFPKISLHINKQIN